MAVTKKLWDLSCLILLMGFVIIIPSCFQVFLTQEFLMTIAFVIQKERDNRLDNSKIIFIKQRQTLNQTGCCVPIKAGQSQYSSSFHLAKERAISFLSLKKFNEHEWRNNFSVYLAVYKEERML